MCGIPFQIEIFTVHFPFKPQLQADKKKKKFFEATVVSNSQ